MQRALRAELESPNPDLTAFRAYATSLVALDPEALRALDTQPSMRSPSPVPAGSTKAATTKAATTKQAEVASRATEEVSVAASRAAAEASGPARGTRASSKRAPATLSRPSPAGCRYCGSELPDSRELTFCPHCGQNLSVKQCPACNTELELDWRFCITCGRESD
jgi:NADH pyrophosphatase NudC (nudix superfamily)